MKKKETKAQTKARQQAFGEKWQLKKGDVLNPTGKGGFVDNPQHRWKGGPTKASITERMRQILNEPKKKGGKTWKELVVRRILDKAVKGGDNQMLKAIWNYIDGMPTQNINQQTTHNQQGMLSIQDAELIVGNINKAHSKKVSYLEGQIKHGNLSEAQEAELVKKVESLKQPLKLKNVASPEPKPKPKLGRPRKKIGRPRKKVIKVKGKRGRPKGSKTVNYTTTPEAMGKLNDEMSSIRTNDLAKIELENEMEILKVKMDKLNS